MCSPAERSQTYPELQRLLCPPAETDREQRCMAAIKLSLQRNKNKCWSSQLQGTCKPWKPLRIASSVDEFSRVHRAICWASLYYANYKLIYYSLHSQALLTTNALLQRACFKTSSGTFMILMFNLLLFWLKCHEHVILSQISLAPSYLLWGSGTQMKDET